MVIDPRHVSIYTLDDNDMIHIPEFDCDDSDMNRFFVDECKHEQDLGLNKTYVLYYKGELAAFCSICADRIALANSEVAEIDLPRSSVPAIKVARLGREKKHKELKLGRYLLQYVQLQVLKVAEEYVGVRFLTLDAYPIRVGFYESLGFISNTQQDARKGTISMRLDIYTDMDNAEGASNENTAS